MKQTYNRTWNAAALGLAMAGALTCLAAEPSPEDRPASGVTPVNYVLHVDWKDKKGGTNSLQLVTAEGNFRLETSQPSAVRIGDAEFPISVNVSGELRVLNAEHGRLQFFLGRSVPFVSNVGGPPGSANIQQRQQGMNSTFMVTFGHPVLIQKDANGEVTVLVQREKP